MSRKAGTRGKGPSPLRLDGELTIYAVSALHQRLLAVLNEARPVDLDLSDVAEIDSAGIQQLLLFKRDVEALGHPVRVVAHSDAVAEVFGLLNLTQTFAPPASAA